MTLVLRALRLESEVLADCAVQALIAGEHAGSFEVARSAQATGSDGRVSIIVKRVHGAPAGDSAELHLTIDANGNDPSEEQLVAVITLLAS